MTDLTNMSEEETALIVAMQGGFEPRADDTLVRALEARGLVRACDAHDMNWSLTEAGAAYELGRRVPVELVADGALGDDAIDQARSELRCPSSR
jgi:hypothetical protein